MEEEISAPAPAKKAPAKKAPAKKPGKKDPAPKKTTDPVKKPTKKTAKKPKRRVNTITKKSQKNSCSGLKGFYKKCPGLSGWHKKTNFDKFKDSETCTALVFTKGKTCKSFCNKQNRVCLYA